MPEDRQFPDRIAIPLLVLSGLALHLPWLWAPFGFFEINAGYFFGPFAQSWERFGFLACRGAPLGAFDFPAADPSGAFPYFNHPPGSFWLCALFGTSEWALRLPTVAAAILVGPWLWSLLRPALGSGLALALAVLVQLVPAVAFSSQVSYEAPVLCAGLLLLALQQRQLAAPTRARAIALAATAFVGTWFDWAFAFFVVALVPLSWSSSLRATVRAVRLPVASHAVSLALVLAWLGWARNAPFVRQDLAGKETLAQVIDRALFAWPPLREFVDGIALLLGDGYSWPLMVAAAIGLPLACRRQPRLLLALWLPGLLNIGLFRSHSYNHSMYVTYLAPGVVAAAGFALAPLLRHRRLRVAAALAGALIAAVPLWRTLDFKRGAAQPIFAVLGRTLTGIADGPSPDGDPRPVAVATNAEMIYPYYAGSPRIYLFPALMQVGLESARKGAARVRYLFLQFERRPAASTAPPAAPAPAELHRWLQQFKKHPVPELVGRWRMRDDLDLVIHGAWVYDL